MEDRRVISFILWCQVLLLSPISSAHSSLCILPSWSLPTLIFKILLWAGGGSYLSIQHSGWQEAHITSLRPPWPYLVNSTLAWCYKVRPHLKTKSTAGALKYQSAQSFGLWEKRAEER